MEDISLRHVPIGILYHDFWTISLSWLLFWHKVFPTSLLSSPQRFPIRLRSGDWLGHSRTSTFCSRNQSFTTREACFGPLSISSLQRIIRHFSHPLVSTMFYDLLKIVSSSVNLPTEAKEPCEQSYLVGLLLPIVV